MSRRPVSEEIKKERRDAVKKTIKGLIFPVIFTAVVCVCAYFAAHYEKPVAEDEVVVPEAYAGDEEPIILENSNLKFTMDPLSTQFEILVKSSGKVWKSNPDGASSDPQALGKEKNRLQSTLLMTYSVTNGSKTDFDNYSFSIENGIYEIETGDDYVTIDYSLGDVEKEYIMPPVTTVERFLSFTDKMSSEGEELAKSYYKKYDINKLTKRDNKEELLEKYPIMETEPIYVLRDTVKDTTKGTLQGYFESAGYTYEDLEFDKQYDNANKVSDKPIFNLTMTYRLEEDALVVELPLNKMECKSEFNIYEVTPLPYFGAGGKADEGFMFVPEGGGAVINFNNGKTSQPQYAANLYGWDMCLKRDSIVHSTLANMNVFGVSKDNDSFICVIEGGSPYATVQASISGINNSYNSVNSVYTVAQREQFDVGDIASTDVFSYILELPDEVYSQRYRFVDSGSYVDMAKSYRSYLEKEYGSYLTANNDTDAPAVIEIVGAIDKVKQIVGIPVSRPLELTSFDEAAELLEDLQEDGFKNMSVKMLGWCNGGVNQKYFNNIRVLHQLGGKKDLKKLSNKATELGVNLYLNGSTQYAYDSNIFNGFFSYTDAAKRISRERAELFVYSSVTYAEREGVDRYWLLHPDIAMKAARKLIETCDKYNTGIAFEDNGKDLSADYYRKDTRSRQNVMLQQVDLFKELKDDGKKVMINSGNIYALPYADVVTNMDLSGSQYTILDAEVPFYEIAMHGYVDYTGESLNICGDYQDELLYTVEYGAGLQFTLMKESAFTLQDSLYTKYYGCDYDVWRERIAETYNRYNSELGHVFNQKIDDYIQVSPKVGCTVYEDGTKVYVNHAYSDFTTDDGIVVPARDYVTVR